MDYFYHGTHRLQLGFEQPNHCATFLALLLLLMLGSSGYLQKKSVLWVKWGCLILNGGIGLGIISLVATYSRGGWLAFLGGITWLFVLRPKMRWRLAGWTLAFLLGIALLPHGGSRVASLLDQEDLSQTHRIEVWHGALAMMADYPWTGVGTSPGFGPAFTAWYEPLEMRTQYRTALNNYLTVGAERGVVLLAAYLALILTPLMILWELGGPEKNDWHAGLGGAQVAFAIASWFTCDFSSETVMAGFFILLALTVITAIKAHYQGSITRKNRRNILGWSGISVGVSTLVLYLAGLGYAHVLPTRFTEETIRVNGQNRETWRVWPRYGSSKGTIFYIPETGMNWADLGQDRLRPLAARGWQVVTMIPGSKLREGLQDSVTVLHWAQSQAWARDLSFSLAGCGSGAQLGFLAAAQFPEVIAHLVLLDMEPTWPFPDLSPQEQLRPGLGSIHLLYTKDSWLKNKSHALEFHRKAVDLAVRCDLEVTSNSIDNVVAYANELSGKVTRFIK